MPLPVVCILLLLVGAGSAGCLGLVQPAAVPPVIVPVDGATFDGETAYSFPFEQQNISIRVAVDPAVYAGAKQADKAIYLYEDFTKDEWLPLYYRAFVNDTHQRSFYADLLGELRAVRDREGLDDDRYLELLTAFVQTIPYRTDDRLIEPKFPIETFADGYGDCDDKSLLLAGILAREGYGTALLYFAEEQHMAVGVKASGCNFSGTGYAYLEVTNGSYIGLPPQELADGTEIVSEPLVIPVGAAGREYGRCGEIGAIQDALLASHARFTALGGTIATHATALQEMERQLASLRTEIDRLRAAGDISTHNARVSAYNGLVNEYNALCGEYTRMVEDSQVYADIHNYIVTHTHDRPGTYRFVQEHRSVLEGV
ncbi:hypothetical protein FGU65_09040 [Methanoculleus sp. FWC-SCC1]|uniref:Transglutaminase-like superfamily protein n=1 Tax=Methanoculleus frigidifontis TaxID=2584085 RepID=A0ABT8MAS1_9EURY|nr:hypothetical protein [Methanoculleus sp. FWC-SCC1]